VFCKTCHLSNINLGTYNLNAVAVFQGAGKEKVKSARVLVNERRFRLECGRTFPQRGSRKVEVGATFGPRGHPFVNHRYV
jgi:hypothetical protein